MLLYPLTPAVPVQQWSGPRQPSPGAAGAWPIGISGPRSPLSQYVLIEALPRLGRAAGVGRSLRTPQLQLILDYIFHFQKLHRFWFFSSGLTSAKAFEYCHWGLIVLVITSHCKINYDKKKISLVCKILKNMFVARPLMAFRIFLIFPSIKKLRLVTKTWR